ncbi:MAG: 50S ribosomal protein L3 [Candidatus Lambdaproteobacteria bacterium]|nr:50S ribosomal protein L3 [Candidatus Lambdaproteobacteria bacterium]
MLNGMVGRKLGMTQIFTATGERIPVTVVEVGPVTVVQVKTAANDGYDAVQVGFDPITHENRVNKPTRGHFKGVAPTKVLREFRADAGEAVQPGQTFDLSMFAVGEKVDVIGISKGKGFQGVIKRHHFAGGPAAHGSRFHRRPGSIGNRTFPGRVFKNKRMPGHQGARRVTIQNLVISRLVPERNLILIRGAIPSHTGAVVEIRKARKVAAAKA